MNICGRNKLIWKFKWKFSEFLKMKNLNILEKEDRLVENLVYMVRRIKRKSLK